MIPYDFGSRTEEVGRKNEESRKQKADGSGTLWVRLTNRRKPKAESQKKTDSQLPTPKFSPIAYRPSPIACSATYAATCARELRLSLLKMLLT